MSLEKRICKKHGLQPLSEYYLLKNGAKQYYKCKLCTRANVKKSEKKNGGNIEKQRRYRQEWKMKVFRHYSNSEIPFCQCCNETIFEFLTLDHKFGGGTKHRKETGGGGSLTYKWAIDNDYPDIFRVLCYSCNACYGIYGNCPHQTSWAPTTSM
jgi:hypothetical protein